MPSPPAVILVGFMGSGKTTAGKLLARALHCRFQDVDRWIEKGTGKSVAKIFREEGEGHFRRLERAAVRTLVRKGGVIATGGGLWQHGPTRRWLLRHGWCVWLRVSARTAWKRVSRQPGKRPLLSGSVDPLRAIRRILVDREPHYAAAHFKVATDGRSSRQVAGLILKAMRKERPGDLSELQK